MILSLFFQKNEDPLNVKLAQLNWQRQKEKQVQGIFYFITLSKIIRQNWHFEAEGKTKGEQYPSLFPSLCGDEEPADHGLRTQRQRESVKSLAIQRSSLRAK